MASDDPLVKLARGFGRSFLKRLDEETAERWEELADEHGLWEATAEVGFDVAEHVTSQRRASAVPPLISEQPDEETDDGLKRRLTIDVAPEHLSLFADGDVLLLRTPQGTFEHDVGWRIDAIEELDDAGTAATEVELRHEAEEAGR